MDGGRLGFQKDLLLPKISHTYPIMMKLGTLYLTYIKPTKYRNHMIHTLSSANISIFSPEISKFWFTKNYLYRLHFDT